MALPVASPGLAARVFGVLTSPRAAALLSTKVGQEALLDQQIRQVESFGGSVNDAQFSVVGHSGVVLIVSSLFVLPLDYARGSLSSPTSLAVFVPVLDENSFPARLLGSIDLFLIWWMISLAIGLGVLYKRRTAPIATTMLLTYGAIGLVIAGVRSALAGA